MSKKEVELTGKRRPPQWLQPALAAYVVAGLFAIGYLLAAAMGFDPSRAAIVGALVAAPLAIGFVWNRIGVLRAWGIEVDLNLIEVDVEKGVKIEMVEAASAQAPSSEAPNLSSGLRDVHAQEDIQLVQVHLGSEPYWWSTRLYILCALIDDHSHVRRLVFVQGDKVSRYVGMASPGCVRRALAKLEPYLAERYQNVVVPSAIQGGDLMTERVRRWVEEDWPGKSEKERMDYVTAESLHALLGDKLETERVIGGEEGPLLYYRILSQDVPFVPLVVDDQLKRVIDANALARRQTLDALERALTR